MFLLKRTNAKNSYFQRYPFKKTVSKNCIYKKNALKIGLFSKPIFALN